MGKALGWIIGLVVIVGVAWFAYNMVSVRQTQEAQLPNVTVTGGQLPKADVDVGSVSVGSETRTVEVPTLNVTPPAQNGATAN